MLDMMKMDLANFTIQQMRPYIQQQSVEYERKKFEEFKEKQRGMLDYLLVLLLSTKCFNRFGPQNTIIKHGYN